MKFEKREEKVKNKKFISEMSEYFNLNEEIVKILISRGYKTKRDIKTFLEPNNFKYHNPLLLKGMKETVDILQKAIKEKKSITVLGDYDTDGICATAILYKYFESMGLQINYFLPNRFVDGYGLTYETIDKIITEFNPDILITVDCGVSSYKEIEYAKEKGLTVIVTDHHEIPEIAPDCIIINPKIKDQEYPFRDLCGAGVALKLVQAMAGYKYANKLTSIAAFATIADIVPLKDENRAIVFNGLKNFKETLPLGVLKLIEKFKIAKLEPSDVSFRIAPKINTAGRMGDASIAFKLFIENDEKAIMAQIEELQNLNDVRVNDGNDIYEEALEMLKDEPISDLGAIVLYKDEWNGGVLGIVCAKLVEKFNKPVCLLSKIENEYKGSVRSNGVIDIYNELTKLNHLLIRFGGHNQAGGLSIEEFLIPEFKRKLNENIKEAYNEKAFVQVKYYDIDINKTAIDDDFIEQIKRLEPFGFGNEKPILKYTFNNARVNKMKNYPNHIKIRVSNLDIVGFNLGGFVDAIKTNSNKDVLLEFNGNYTHSKTNLINTKILALKVNKLNTGLAKEIVNANIIKQLNFVSDSTDIKPIQITKENESDFLDSTILNSNFGNLIITNNFENYQVLVAKLKNNILNYELFDLKTKTGENTIIYLPDYNLKPIGYNNVILLEEPLTEGYLNNFEGCNVFIYNILNKDRKKTSETIKMLYATRDVFGNYHNAIKNTQKKKDFVCYSEKDYFEKLTRLNPQFKNLKYEQFIFTLLVLKELGILTYELGEEFILNINDNVKTALDNSSIYNFVRFFNKLSK